MENEKCNLKNPLLMIFHGLAGRFDVLAKRQYSRQKTSMIVTVASLKTFINSISRIIHIMALRLIVYENTKK